MKRAVISILLGALASAAFCAPIPAERAAEALLTAFFTGDEAGVARNSSPQGLRKFSGHDREELIREAARFGVFRGILSSRELGEDRVEVRCRFSAHPVRFLVSCAPDGRVNGFTVLPDIDIPRLTRAQMLADFDYLTAMLEKICPLFTVNRKVYDVDITGTLAAYRSRITGDESPEAFYRLIQDALQACRGNHLWVTAALTELPPALHDFLSVYRGFVDPAALETTAAVAIREGGRRPAGPDLGLIYCEGAYYTKFDFTLHGVTYPRGMKLLSIDGISPELFLAEQNDHLDNFDAARKTFYDSGEIPFYTRSGRWGKMPLVFRFERPDGATVTFPLASGDKLVWKGPLRQPWHIPRLVEYLPGPEILYIRIPAMREEDIPFYRTQILEKSKNRKIRAAVLDVRNNPGGSDAVWNEILALLIPGPWSYSTTFALKDSPEMRRFLQQHREFYRRNRRSYDMPGLNEFRQVAVPYLDNEKFLAATFTKQLPGNRAVLPERVPIYVIAHNIYSSAGNLTAVAKQLDFMTSVGLDNPKSLGRGIDPFFFSLPNSKLVVSVEPALDLTGCRRAADTLHTKVEQKVDLTPAEYVEYWNSNPGRNPVPYLLHRDPFMRKVLQLQKDGAPHPSL